MSRDVLILRLDAPLMSFGGVRVDARGPTQDYPALAMISGLLANALGYDRREADAMSRLQGRVRYATRCDRAGVRITDYQIVDITRPEMKGPGWTTRGAPEWRQGGKETLANLHERWRDYWADAVYTIALWLEPPEESPDLAAIESALREPERPLFLGRKACLPAAPLFVERRKARSLLEALNAVPRLDPGRSRSEPLRAWVPEEEAPAGPSRVIAVTDERDWANDIVVGRRLVFETTVDPPEASDAR